MEQATGRLPVIETSPCAVLQHVLPKSQKIFFEKSIKDLNEETQATLAKATFAREEFTLSLERSTPDACIRTCERYLPYMFGLLNVFNSMPPEAHTNLKIHWSSALTVKYKSQPIISVSFQWEVVNVLLIYGLLHRNLAGSILDSMTSSNSSGEVFEKNTKEIARNLCTAAGIFDYLRDSILPHYSRRSPEVIPELSIDTYSALAWQCLAEAQEVAIRKAVTNKTSEGLLSKLCIEVGNRYSGVGGFYRNIPGLSPDAFLPALRAYAAYNEMLWGCMYLKYLGIAAYKNGKYGEAVVCMKKAMRDLTPEPSRVEPALVNFNQQYKEERLQLDKIGRVVIHDNETIYYDPLPAESTMQFGAEGKLVIKTVEFVPPPPQHIELTFLKGSDCVLQ